MDLPLSGCRPEPLGSYLKALGVLRLVTNQGADRDARGHWPASGTFVMTSALSREGIINFLVDDYRPTPLVAPWNSGAGFRVAGKRPTAELAVSAIEQSDLGRLDPYKAAIRSAFEVVKAGEARGWRDPKGKSFWLPDRKRSIIEMARAILPDDAVEWVDSCVVLSDRGEGWPPLLGTGGVLGSQELSNNFMQRLAEVCCLKSGRGAPSRTDSREWLQASLFADRAVPHLRVAAGQFDPGRAGGVLSSPLEEVDGFVNPWDFVLTLEGALVFASAAARQLEAATAKPSFPFMFAGSSVGYSTSVSGEKSKGEIWAPLWSRPAGIGEIGRLIGEGRATWRGRQAATGVDVARAAATLGVDRGITSFARHVFVERHGQNMLAIPAGRVVVSEHAGVELMAAIDGWLNRASRGRNVPSAVKTANRVVEAAMFELAGSASGDSARRFQDVLVALARAEAAVGRSGSQRKQCPPVRGLQATAWLPALDDGTREFRLAVALASGRDDDGSCLRWLLRPINARGWTDAPGAVEGLGTADVVSVLAATHVRRMVEATATSRGRGDTGEEGTGVQTAFRWKDPCLLADVAAFLSGNVDEQRLGALLSACLLLHFDRPLHSEGHRVSEDDSAIPADLAWSLLAPFFHGGPISIDSHILRLKPEISWPAQLAANRVDDVASGAIRRLRMARRDPSPERVVRSTGSQAGRRLAAALLFPLDTSEIRKVLSRTAPPRSDQ